MPYKSHSVNPILISLATIAAMQIVTWLTDHKKGVVIKRQSFNNEEAQISLQAGSCFSSFFIHQKQTGKETDKMTLNYDEAGWCTKCSELNVPKNYTAENNAYPDLKTHKKAEIKKEMQCTLDSLARLRG